MKLLRDIHLGQINEIFIENINFNRSSRAIGSVAVAVASLLTVRQNYCLFFGRSHIYRGSGWEIPFVNPFCMLDLFAKEGRNLCDLGGHDTDS